MDFFKLPAAESLDLSEEEIAVLQKIFAATGGASIGLRERGVGTEICLFHQDPSAIWLRSSLDPRLRLDATGDRQNGGFDFWAVRSVNGSYGWVRTGTYDDGVLTVF